MQLNILFDFLGKSFIPQGEEVAKNAGSGNPSGGFGSALAAALGFSTPGSGAGTDASSAEGTSEGTSDGTAGDGLVDGLSIDVASAEASTEGHGEANDANLSKQLPSDAEDAPDGASDAGSVETSADGASRNPLQTASPHPSSDAASDALTSGAGTVDPGSSDAASDHVSEAGVSIVPEDGPGDERRTQSTTNTLTNALSNTPSNTRSNNDTHDAPAGKSSSRHAGINPTRASENLPATGAAAQGNASHPPREVATANGPTPDATSDNAASADALSTVDENVVHDGAITSNRAVAPSIGDGLVSGDESPFGASPSQEGGERADGRTTERGSPTAERATSSSRQALSSDVPRASASGTATSTLDGVGPSVQAGSTQATTTGEASAQGSSALGSSAQAQTRPSAQGQPERPISEQGQAAQTRPAHSPTEVAAHPEASVRQGDDLGSATTKSGPSIDSELPSESPQSASADARRSATARTDGPSEHGKQAGTAAQPSSSGASPDGSMLDDSVRSDAAGDRRPSDATDGSDDADSGDVDPDAAAEMAARNGDERPLRSNRSDAEADRKNGSSPSAVGSQGNPSFSDGQSGSFSNARDQQLAPRQQDMGSQTVDAADFQDALDELPADEPIVTSQAEETAFTPEQKGSPASVFSVDAAQSSSRARTTGTMAWLRSLLAQSTRSLSLSQGWKSIEVQLEDGMGTMTVRARRGDDGVAVSVHFSDPNLRSLAETNVQRLQEALRSEYEANVDLSLMSDGSTDTPDRQNPSGSDRRNLRDVLPDAIPAEMSPEFGASTRPTRAGIRNEWIG